MRVRVPGFEALALAPGDFDTVTRALVDSMIEVGRGVAALLRPKKKVRVGEIVKSSEDTGWPRGTTWSCTLTAGRRTVEVVVGYRLHPADGDVQFVRVDVAGTDAPSLSANLGPISPIHISNWMGDPTILDHIAGVLDDVFGGGIEIIERIPPQ